jgi:hypothetical protein
MRAGAACPDPQPYSAVLIRAAGSGHKAPSQGAAAAASNAAGAAVGVRTSSCGSSTQGGTPSCSQHTGQASL